MTLLVDPPLLVAAGAAIERGSATSGTARRLEALALTGFLGAGTAFYCNAGVTRPLWRLLRVESGRDFMLNSYVLALEHRRPSPRAHALAALVFASYPLWIRLGRRLGRRRARPGRPGIDPRAARS